MSDMTRSHPRRRAWRESERISPTEDLSAATGIIVGMVIAIVCVFVVIVLAMVLG